MKRLQKLFEDDYEEFESLDNIEKSSYVQGCEEWKRKLMVKTAPPIIVGV